MDPKISVVINTLNEEQNIERAIKSVGWADELIVCDMYSEDKTATIAKKMGAKVFFHKKEEFVELARNFALSKASNSWILVLDPDEEIQESLAQKLREIALKMKGIDYVRLPRKNLIFGHFMRASMWWPDYNIRFFKRGNVKWVNQIHRPPEVTGQGLDLPADEKYAIIHYSYETIPEFIQRMDRYTTIQAGELNKEGYKFRWADLFEKPLNEFLSRFFAKQGYLDGVFGLSLSLLQAFSFLVVYLKLWEISKFSQQHIDLAQIEQESKKSAFAINYWIKQTKLSKNPFKRFLQKITG